MMFQSYISQITTFSRITCSVLINDCFNPILVELQLHRFDVAKEIVRGVSSLYYTNHNRLSGEHDVPPSQCFNPILYKSQPSRQVIRCTA